MFRKSCNGTFLPRLGVRSGLIGRKRQIGIRLLRSNRFADILKFPHFQDEWLRDLPNEIWVPRKFRGRPFNIFETGGTTGMPKQRIGWEDYKVDYSEFSEKLSDEQFPRNHYWLMMGPTGPRRLRLAVEHLANVRGCACYFIDLDPRWVKKLTSATSNLIRRERTWIMLLTRP